LIVLACGIGLLVLVQDRRVELPVLIGLSLASAASVWQQLAGAGVDTAAQVLAAGVATGGITATLIISLSGLEQGAPADGVVAKPQLARQVWRLIGAGLLIVILVGAPAIGLGPLLEAAMLLLAGGMVVCLLADRLQRATAGLVVLLFGFHLLYLAMVSRMSILELLVLDSLPIVATLVVASFRETLAALPATGWTQISPDPDFDMEEPLL
jgi:hypothetical protein